MYTSSKDMAEDIVMSANIEKLVVRLPWIFGKYTENFISDLRKGKEVRNFWNAGTWHMMKIFVIMS